LIDALDAGSDGRGDWLGACYFVAYAVETVGLVKRYSVAPNGTFIGPDGRPKSRSVQSFTGLFGLFKKQRGPYIEALKGVDLKIKKGEIFGILGPNGAGKTTLIKILCTLVLRDGGEVYVNGYDPSESPSDVLRNLQAVLPESRGFNWRLSGRQNLEFYALLYGLRGDDARARIGYLLDYTGLRERADDCYQKYSTGMQRRLLLCRALIRDTPIIVFDEPTAGLDPTGAVEFRDLLIERLSRREGKTILLSTHNLQEAQGLCDRIAILDHGGVIACDTPDNVRHLVTEKRVMRVVFSGMVYGPIQDRLISALKEAPGVNSVSPTFDQEGILTALTIRLDKDADISGVLSILTDGGLSIKSVNMADPSLEDAFMAMTGRGASSQGAGRAEGDA
jgi:ABC-2 type transport system ATP-binding protein